MREGLSQSQVFVLFESKVGEVYAGTNNGVNKFMAFENQLEGHFQKYCLPEWFCAGY